VDEVRDLDGRLCGRRALAGTGDSLRELRGLAEPLVVREHPDVHAHEIGYAVTACTPLARPLDEANETPAPPSRLVPSSFGKGQWATSGPKDL
jgi:hypothetical protein